MDRYVTATNKLNNALIFKFLLCENTKDILLSFACIKKSVGGAWQDTA